MWTVTIGQPITKPELKNLYRLSVVFMSGDGDGYETEHYDFKTVEQLSLYLNVLDTYRNLEWNQQCDIEESSDWAKIGGFVDDYKKRSELTPQQRAFIDFGESIPGDICTLGETRAAPSSWGVTYFDGEGVEHKTSVVDPQNKPLNGNRH